MDIEKHPEKLSEMLVYSKGDEHVPVIVEGQKILIGFNKDVFRKEAFSCTEAPEGQRKSLPGKETLPCMIQLFFNDYGKKAVVWSFPC